VTEIQAILVQAVAELVQQAQTQGQVVLVVMEQVILTLVLL
jgi:hypothetical protein